MPLPLPKDRLQAAVEIKRQYQLEREWAERLKAASAEERGGLYAAAYRAFNQLAASRSQPCQERNVEASAHAVALRIALLKKFLSPTSTVLEIGAGDCALACALSADTASVIAVEVASPIGRPGALPENLRLLLADSSTLPIAPETVDVAFSCHFIEHLHPEDARHHAGEMARVLRPGGTYVCVTPNRFYGPHDISKYFDDEPRGLHLREYSYSDLAVLLRRSGFARIDWLQGIGCPPENRPVLAAIVLERLVTALPTECRQWLLNKLGSRPPFRPFEQVVLAARK